MGHQAQPQLLSTVLLLVAVWRKPAYEVTLGLQAQVPGALHEVLDRLAAKRNELYRATGLVVAQLLDVGRGRGRLV